MQPVYKNASALLYLHPVQRIVHHELLRRPTGTDFRDLLMKGYELLKKNHCTKWLSDDRLHTVLSEEDELWARTEWFPLVAKAGWRFWAVVNPEKAIGQLQTKQHAKFMEVGGVKVATFSTVNEALDWLTTIDRP